MKDIIDMVENEGIKLGTSAFHNPDAGFCGIYKPIKK